MTIAFTSLHLLKCRFVHFLNTLKKDGCTIFDHNTYTKIPQADIWMIDYVYTSNYLEDNTKRFDELLPQMLKFKGKIILLNVNDSCSTYAAKLNAEFIERVDCVLVLNRYAQSSIHSSKIFKKTLLLPRFTIDYQPLKEIQQRDNKVFFVGRLTGSDFFKGKNWRIEALNKIQNDEFLRNNFCGWIASDNKVLPDRLKNNEYFVSSNCLKQTTLSLLDYCTELLKNQISLCLPGNTAWGFRHLHSLSCKNTIVSFNLSTDCGEWLFQNMFNDSFYLINDDLSNLELQLTNALVNVEESKMRAQKSYEVYQEYFELLPDNTYQNHVWKRIKNSFSSVGINF